ncbi:condensation domain-containing protein [Actinomadura sp. ATCC 39365]
MTDEATTAEFPLTPIQELMLAHSVRDPLSPAVLVQYALRCTGPFDPLRYGEAWQRLVDRHTALRTCFVRLDGAAPVQRINRSAELPVTITDLAGTDPGAALAELARADGKREFRLDKAPLLRLSIGRLSPGEHVILVTMHHLIVDGWSAELMLEEAAWHYREPRTPREPTDFGVYLDWLKAQDDVHAESYWRGELAEATPGCGQLGALLRPSHHAGVSHPQEVRSALTSATAEALVQRARRARVTPNVLTRSLWGLLLSRYNGRAGTIFAVTMAGRPFEIDDVDRLVGPFLNNVPVLVAGPGDEPLDAWLLDLQRRQAVGADYQWCSPGQIHGWSGKSLSATTCDSLFVFQNYPGDLELAPLGDGVAVHREAVPGASIRTGYPLTVTVTLAGELTLRTTHDSGVVSRPGVERLHEDFAGVLTAFAEGARTVADLPLPPLWTPRADVRGERPAARPYTAPETEVERRICALTAEVLDLDDFGLHDDVFEAGCNSVAAMYLARKLQEDFDVPVPVAEVFLNPTPAQLAITILAAALRRARQ